MRAFLLGYLHDLGIEPFPFPDTEIEPTDMARAREALIGASEEAPAAPIVRGSTNEIHVEKGLILTYFLTYGGALVSLGRLFVGLLIYICFAIVKPEALWYWSVPRGNYSRIIAGALLVAWVLHGFGNWRLGRASGM